MSEDHEVVVVQGAPDLSEIQKQKLKQDIELAKRKQKALMDRRKKSPVGVSVGQVFSDPRDELVRRLVPEALPEPKGKNQRRTPGHFGGGAKMRVIFAPDEKRRKLLSDGWEPVTEDGHHVDDGGDFMYKRPMELTLDKKRIFSELNKQRIREEADKELSDNATSDGLVENVTEVTEK